MSEAFKLNELIALRAIAETLNTSNDINQMLDNVLKKLLEVTGLTTGWIFLVEEKPEYTCAVDHGLPPALIWGEKTPMCTDVCWCLSRYWKGTLQHAVNIINCKRIEDAIEYKWGDTDGITHHATVPLEAGGEMFGILNVAAPNKEHFDEEELALLQSIAYQIGTAVNRAKLYHAQQKRADGYVKLRQISESIGSVLELRKIPELAIEMAGKLFKWPETMIYIKEGNKLSLRGRYNETDGLLKQWKSIALNDHKITSLSEVFCNKMVEVAGVVQYQTYLVAPIRIHGEADGLIMISSPKKNTFDSTDQELIEALGRAVALALENAKLYEQRREVSRLEERNRLARDLHDSVCQTLFSLNLTARASELMLNGPEQMLKESLKDMQGLTDSALRQMRELIWQLRPGELEEGLITALKKYGERLGLRVRIDVKGVKDLPGNIEEALWRIGQEGLNNVKKHANVTDVEIVIEIMSRYVTMTITDRGEGFSDRDLDKSQSMGMISIRERIDLLGGSLILTSKPTEGTQIAVTIPYDSKEEKL